MAPEALLYFFRYLQTRLPNLNELSAGKLRGLTALEHLHVLGSQRLGGLEAGLLRDMPRLVSVDFTDCGISWIHPRALSSLPSLKELSFVNNR